MDGDLQSLKREALENSVPLDTLLLFSIAVSLKRIADKLPGPNAETLLAQISKSLGEISQVQ